MRLGIMLAVLVSVLALAASSEPATAEGKKKKRKKAACTCPPRAPEKDSSEVDEEPTPQGPPAAERPTDGEVSLGSAAGWNATLVIDQGPVGIWTVKSYQVFPQYGCPEVVGLDDLGRCHVMVSYSGRWTPHTVINDGTWLGGLAHGDVDPRFPGAEIYTGSKKGNIYQVLAHGNGILDSRRIAFLPGREIHTILDGDLDPGSPGKEILVFTRPGALFRLSPTGPNGTFDVEKIAELDGRYRDAVILPAEEGTTPEIACVARTGHLRILRMTKNGPEFKTIYQAEMGMGRVALAPAVAGRPTVLYTTHDDGRILRHERRASGDWTTETIFLGPLGPRGVCAGQFHEDPGVETVATFGYSGKVFLLSRQDGKWKSEQIFLDRDKGHWMATAEVDGRNNTREIVTSGYSGRIVMLSRPAGYGMAVTTPDE